MKEIVIVVDLGHFKAYRLIKSPMGSPRLELIEEYDNISAHGRLSEKLSDEAGRFGMGMEKGSIKGYGEAHHLELDIQKKIIKLIVKDINALINAEKPERWYLAAPKKVNNQIVENLLTEVRETLKKNVKADLTKVKKSELLEYFE